MINNGQCLRSTFPLSLSEISHLYRDPPAVRCLVNYNKSQKPPYKRIFNGES